MRLVNDTVEVFDDTQLWNEIIVKRDVLLNTHSDKTGVEWDEYRSKLSAIVNDGSNPLKVEFLIPPEK